MSIHIFIHFLQKKRMDLTLTTTLWSMKPSWSRICTWSARLYLWINWLALGSIRLVTKQSNTTAKGGLNRIDETVFFLLRLSPHLSQHLALFSLIFVLIIPSHWLYFFICIPKHTLVSSASIGVILWFGLSVTRCSAIFLHMALQLNCILFNAATSSGSIVGYSTGLIFCLFMK